MKNKITMVNVFSSLMMQIVSVISALIVPRIILTNFGSNANGLVASVSQFLNYIALVEGGITGVISANLYKPLVDNDEQGLSRVLSTAKAFYNKIGLIFICYSLVLGVIYPLVVKTGYSNIYVFLLTIILSIGLFLQYMFSISYTTLLNADKKVYVVSFTTTILTLVNIVIVVVAVKYFPDIIFVKFASAILFALQPLIYGIYVKKHYQLDWSAPKDNELIDQRWNGFAINIAFFIHSSTDITLLTLFSNLSTVSVYSIYALIITKVSVIIHSIASGIEPTIGQAYAKNDIVELNKKLDLYEYIIFLSVGIIFTVMGLLIAPFVMIYTDNVIDTNYYQPVFGVILVLAEATYLLRTPHVSLAYSANKFKEITVPAYFESVINIVVSVILIKKIGLPGIAIGTLLGMMYRNAFHIRFTSKLIPSRKQSMYYGRLLIACMASLISVLICVVFLPIKEYKILGWIEHAIIYALICGLTYFAASLLFFRKEMNNMKEYIKRK